MKRKENTRNNRKQENSEKLYENQNKKLPRKENEKLQLGTMVRELEELELPHGKLRTGDGLNCLARLAGSHRTVLQK